jgi:hypothetical protein
MDRTTKILLAVIASGLWANALPLLAGGRASAQATGDVCLNAGDCLQAIDGWVADSDHLLTSIAADMKTLLVEVNELKRPESAAPVAPVRPKPAPAPLAPAAKPPAPAAKPSLCLTGAC